MAISETDDRPWYRHLWPWLVMIPPGAAVVGGFLTAWLAGGPPSLVVDDYSEIAMSTRLDQARDRRAAVLGLNAVAELPPAGIGDVSIRLRIVANDPDFAAPASIRLRLVHATREEFDRNAILANDGSTAYIGLVDRPPGRFYLHLTDPEVSWRLVGLLEADATRVSLAPGGTLAERR